MDDTAVVVSGYGKPWTFTVGLVGKPSAGALSFGGFNDFPWENPPDLEVNGGIL